jgi:hypothetical protein
MLLNHFIYFQERKRKSKKRGKCSNGPAALSIFANYIHTGDGVYDIETSTIIGVDVIARSRNK